MTNKADLCVIVATFNSAKTLAKCLDSIVTQSVRPELIIIDGGSSDGTIEIIKAYQEHIDYWVSEPDAGVYDAWNKAIAQANSQWLMFLGSDDRLFELGQLEVLVRYLMRQSVDVDLVYGKIIRDYGERQIEGNENGKLERDYIASCTHMPFTHVGSIHRATSFKVFGPFNKRYRIAGDFEFFCRIRAGKMISYCADHKVLMGMDGLSQSLRFRKKLLNEQIHISMNYRIWKGLTYLIAKYTYYSFIDSISRVARIFPLVNRS
ncbi:MAG: glycosyltransferase [Chitinophagaceae bacterium]|nr:MAG: glycosyltransferase [Chitinophagaceae bacterium]